MQRRELDGFLILGLCASFGAGCLESTVAHCADGRLCPEDMACDDAHMACVLPEQLAGCTGKASRARCSYPGVRDGTCYEQVCLPAGCGNGIKDEDEVCDDGNRKDGDGCSRDCRSDETCGNGVHDPAVGELCEPTEAMEAYCRPDCVSVRCGDGVHDVEALEQCDEGDANSVSPDAKCRPDCQLRRCGDGVQDTNELCDDGNRNSEDGCSADCTSDESCGNGVIDSAVGETCDHGGTPDARCREDCVSARCGDGKPDLSFFEQCDEGAANSLAPDAPCRPNCQLPRCGDGIEDSGELCDDGNQVSGDGCSFDCQSLETCRNGYVDLAAGEQCDDGNALSHDGCSSSCRTESFRSARVYRGKPLTPNTAYGYPYPVFDARCDCFVTIEAGREVWELHGAAWKKVTFTGPTPQASTGHGLAWDAARGQLLLFGGSDSGTFLDETWAWNGVRFERLRPLTTSPSPRSKAAMVYDAGRQRVVLFGGEGPEGQLHDTWSWDGTDWRELDTMTAPKAAPLWRIAYDPHRGEPLLYDETELWRLTESGWVSTPAATPVPQLRGKIDFSFFYDAARRRPVLYKSGTDFFTMVTGSAWEWDGAAWIALEPAADFVFAELVPSRLLYHPRRQQTLLVTHTGSAWEREGSSWRRIASDTGPAYRTHAAMAYDPLRATTVLFGGFQWDQTPGTLGDTWLWDGVRWNEAPAGTAPPARRSHAMTYDQHSRRVVMFGGDGGGTGTWLWDGMAWEAATPMISPAGRTEHAMVYDAVRRRVLLEGGKQGSLIWAEEGTWLWDGQEWMEAVREEFAVARIGPGLAYDAQRERVVMFGGYYKNPLFDDTWTNVIDWAFHPDTQEWDGASWSTVDVMSPPARGYPLMAYDPNRQATTLFGGWTSDETMWSLAQGTESSLAWNELGQATFGNNDEAQQTIVYEATEARIIASQQCGSPGAHELCVFEVALRDEQERTEQCRHGFDTDRDGLLGCQDPDCWPYCTPLCPPGARCPDEAPRCGDGECNDALETFRMCPEDCSGSPACGDFFCDPGETSDACPGDCG